VVQRRNALARVVRLAHWTARVALVVERGAAGRGPTRLHHGPSDTP
jgi:hypothetical protein